MGGRVDIVQQGGLGVWHGERTRFIITQVQVELRIGILSQQITRQLQRQGSLTGAWFAKNGQQAALLERRGSLAQLGLAP